MLLLILFVFLPSCSNDKRIIHELHQYQTNLEYKTYEKESERFSFRSRIVPLHEPNLNRITSWYGNHEVLILVNDGISSRLEKYNFYTGKRDVFYKSSDFIMQVQPNSNNTYVAIESKDISNNSILTILNAEGDMVLQKKIAVDFLELAWSPYAPSSLMVTSYYPSLQTTIEVMDLEQQEKQELHIEPYVQWFSKDQVAYFDWNNGASLQAPIKIYNIHSTTTQHLSQNAILFDSIPNYFMYMEFKEDVLNVKFVDSTTQNEVNSFDTPVLDSHAGYIWSPIFDWSSTSNLFFIFEAKQAGSLIDYNHGYQLIVYDVQAGKKQDVVSVDEITNLDCSPNGEWCLMGAQLENLVDINTGEIMKLVNEKS